MARLMEASCFENPFSFSCIWPTELAAKIVLHLLGLGVRNALQRGGVLKMASRGVELLFTPTPSRTLKMETFYDLRSFTKKLLCNFPPTMRICHLTWNLEVLLPVFYFSDDGTCFKDVVPKWFPIFIIDKRNDWEATISIRKRSNF